MQAEQAFVGWRVLVFLSCRFTVRGYLCGSGVAFRDRSFDFNQSCRDLLQSDSSCGLACCVSYVLRFGFRPGTAHVAGAKLSAR
jgi:hypothetical protein